MESPPNHGAFQTSRPYTVISTQRAATRTLHEQPVSETLAPKPAPARSQSVPDLYHVAPSSPIPTLQSPSGLQYTKRQISSSSSRFTENSSSASSSPAIAPRRPSQAATSFSARDLFSLSLSSSIFSVKIDSPEVLEREYKDMAEAWDQARLSDRRILSLVWRGFPDELRGSIWKSITNSNGFISKNPGVYEFLVNQVEVCCAEHRIYNDVGRTFPEHPMFKNPMEGQKLLSDLLRAYSVFDQGTGYCQGMNFVAAILLLTMTPEEAFWTYVQLMKTFRLKELFQPGARAIRLLMYKFDRILEKNLPRLHQHLDSYNIEASLYVNHWFITLYSYNFPIQGDSFSFILITDRANSKGKKISHLSSSFALSSNS
eukprot:TRINITY_DN5359_c0_g1_i6.p1 TRINITY_DN5359_c0_g1~~TRINITY_DN5359_c0_g1_i6.p1  ORF type:complete len:372 (-),score=54.13 TRINITY_DN5359_c0_g1_i6:893-2008(-)